MKTHAHGSSRWRAILDGVLILLLALALTARDDNAQAQARDRAAARDQALARYEAAPVVLDNNTLAAMIAAENAALTLPQYLLDLPLVHR
jgi:hypothetical protein